MKYIYLCVQKDCQGKTRYIENEDDILSQTGDHYGHNCQCLEKIQTNLHPLVAFWNENKENNIL